MSKEFKIPVNISVPNGTAPMTVTSQTVVTNLNANLLNGESNYVHPTTDGSLHVPATSTTNSGKVLTAGASAGSFSWEDSPAMSASALATTIYGASSKGTPVGADYFPLLDSAASYGLKKTSLDNLTVPLKAYFDTLYTNTGYCLLAMASLTAAPADGSTVYFGCAPVEAQTSEGVFRIYVPKACTVKAVYLTMYSVTAGTNENITAYIRRNATSDTTIATVGQAANHRLFSNTSLSLGLALGDYIQIKVVYPTWATNPANTIWSGHIYCQ